MTSVAGSSQDIIANGKKRVEEIRQKFIDRGEPVPSKIQFMGVACGAVRNLRDPVNGVIPTEVVYTPTDGDAAHSDFATNATDPELDDVRAELTRRLVYIPADDLSRLQSCGE